MGRVRTLHIKNFRSIKDELSIEFPKHGPLVLVGANNAGKSNIVRALDLVLGEGWPGSFEPEDHDFHGRSRDAVPMEISLAVDDVTVRLRDSWMDVAEMVWRFDPEDERRSAFDIIGPDGYRRYGSNDARDQCFCMVVGADRRLSYQLSYTTKWTLLSRLMRKFHSALVEDDDRVTRLRSLFDDVVQTFLQVEPFSEFSEQLRRNATDFGANLEYALEMDFSAYDPSNFFHSLRVRPRQGESPRSFDELGTGQEQILALAFAYAYAGAFGAGASEGLILVVEEPEAHLHPLAQKWLGRKIYELAELGVQMVITTHSPAFINLERLDGLVLVRKNEVGSRTTVMQQDSKRLAEFCNEHGAAGKATAGSVLPFYASSATDEIVNGVFARACLLVEGPTEALALPVLLERAGFDPLVRGTAVIPVGGIGNLARWWRFFRSYDVPVYVVFDRDSKDDESGARQTDLLQTLGVAASEAQRWGSASSVFIGDAYSVLLDDFESAMRGIFPSQYAQLEQRGHERLGPSKALAARYAAQRLQMATDQPGWDRLSQLGGVIRDLAQDA